MFLGFKKILNLLSSRDRRNLVFLVIFMIIGAIVEAVGIGVILPFLAVVGNPNLIQENDFLKQVNEFIGFTTAYEMIFFLGIGVVCFLVFTNIIKLLNAYFMAKFSFNRIQKLSHSLLSRYLKQDFSFFLNENPAELRKNLLSEITTSITGFFQPLLMAFSKMVSSALILILLFTVDPLVAVIVTLLSSVIFISIYFFTRNKMDRLGKQKVKANRQRYRILNEVFGGIKDIKLLGNEEVYIHQFDKAEKKYIKGEPVSVFIGNIPKFLIESIVFSGIVVFVLVLLALDQDLSEILPILGIYAFAGYRIMPNLQQIFQSINRARYKLPSVDLMHESFQKGQNVDRFEPETRKSPEPMECKKSLDIQSLVFRYNPGAPEVLKNISLKIGAKTTVGLVGTTGSGKTTMVDIILGLLSPESGQILADGVPVTWENRANWQASLAYVPQSIFLIDDSIRRNIAFGIEDSVIEEDRVIQAAKIANIHDFIIGETEKGYDTEVGDRGIRLSGGQRQRIGIARALYRDPSVLILDEATSALDGITEDAIIEAIHKLSHKMTIIMIAHRLTTVQDCDEIYLLEKGVVKDKGSYQELWERNPEFRQMAGDKNKENKNV